MQFINFLIFLLIINDFVTTLFITALKFDWKVVYFNYSFW